MTISLGDLSPADLKIQQVFFPYTFAKSIEVFQKKRRFVYYTSAEAAMHIIQDKEIWMRNAMTMNDISEVQHGLDCLSRAWREEAGGEKFKGALEVAFPGLCEEIAKRFDAWQNEFKSNTYLTCLSEHLDAEDRHGRLSMWRAYGRKSGVALVLNNTPFITVSDELKAYSSPVAYLDDQEMAEQLNAIAINIVREMEFVKSLPQEHVGEIVFAMLRFSVLCTKHKGFQEEREWRILYSPSFGVSPIIRPAVKALNGIPQIVQKIPLRNSPEEGLNGAAIPDLLERLIIGPTEDQAPIFQAFCQLLADAGVAEPHKRIFISGIPLRQ